MDRLSKKCVIGAGIMHGALLLILVVGPAFLGSSEKSDPKEIIDFIPAKVIDASMAGGGNPNVPNIVPPPVPPTPTPPKPEPVVKPEPKPDPEPVKPKLPEPPVKPVEHTISKTDPDALENPKKPHKPVLVLTPVVRKSNSRTTDTSAEDRAQERAEAKRRAQNLASAVNNIRNNATSAVELGEMRGPGGGGPSYASFEMVLRSVYFNNWHEPTDATVEDAVVKASVTIASDGSVLTARITKSSGDPAVDRTVQKVLDSVTFITPFPSGTKETQRTYPLSFSLKAKRGLG